MLYLNNFMIFNKVMFRGFGLRVNCVSIRVNIILLFEVIVDMNIIMEE